MLNEKELEVIEYMDYQVMNNGIGGWLGNRGYEKLNELIQILNKRNSELDQKVISIFTNATISALGYYQFNDSLRFPEIKETLEQHKSNFQQCGEQYQQIAESFMNSYGLVDYGTKFMKKIRG
ncbi:hypothetical protein [Kurthia sp. Dielmo]|uniref:hypothetical protein n=1 Tax=Kurthia sp. Dielmo TaxID=1033738 RepID=UPI0011215C28|nr:hypothetical protein [Kurthia sp. Dielmo]